MVKRENFGPNSWLCPVYQDRKTRCFKNDLKFLRRFMFLNMRANQTFFYNLNQSYSDWNKITPFYILI